MTMLIIIMSISVKASKHLCYDRLEYYVRHITKTYLCLLIFTYVYCYCFVKLLSDQHVDRLSMEYSYNTTYKLNIN